MRFSVITPSFRNSNWLKLCIASVADQGVEVEHIVQDAGSDDGTLDWLTKDSRVKAFVEKDSGMYDAINRGLRRSTGDILSYLNCDEEYLPGALAAVGECFRNNPDVDLVFADFIVVDGSGNYLFHRKVQTPHLYHTWACYLHTFTCATFFRRRVIDEGNFFNPQRRYVGDAEWVVGLLKKGKRSAILRRFTSVFAFTGENISGNPRCVEEMRDFFNTAPFWARKARPLLVAQHRLRRIFAGMYSQAPFSYSIFTHESAAQRIERHVTQPSGIWRQG